MKKDASERDINVIDSEILSLINERYRRILDEVIDEHSPIQRSFDQEAKLLRSLEEANDGPLTSETLRAIFREIFSGSAALRRVPVVAYLGPEASFTELAAYERFGHSAKYSAKTSIADVFHDVETERADFGCVPIENSTEGAVNHTLDMFINSTVTICAETNIRIHHNLMANCDIADIQKVYSHAQVFGQCRNWLQEHLPQAECVEVGSTTKAAMTAVDEPNAAAVASRLAAELYKLNVLVERVEDNPDNITRFMVIGRDVPEPTDDDKTSLCFGIKDKVGALYECLIPFKEENITMTMIESRPSKRKNWEYSFFVDILGHVSDPRVDHALKRLAELSRFVKILGSYPRNGAAT